MTIGAVPFANFLVFLRRLLLDLVKIIELSSPFCRTGLSCGLEAGMSLTTTAGMLGPRSFFILLQFVRILQVQTRSTYYRGCAVFWCAISPVTFTTSPASSKC